MTVGRVLIEPLNKRQIINFSTRWRNGLTINYITSLDHRAFMKEFIEELERLKFDDIGTDLSLNKYRAKQGEFDKEHKTEIIDSKGDILSVPWKRIANTYETRSAMFLNPDNSIDIEWEIKAYKEAYLSSKFGRYELKVELVCRVGKEVEKLVGEKKKKLISGRWEFRNYLHYTDSVIPDYLDKLPIVKNFTFIKQAFIDHFWYKKLQAEENYLGESIYPRLNNIVLKHFSEEL